MSIICAICSDHLTESEEIVYTQCAHVFHSRCLTTWVERSKSCPHCREKVTLKKIRRLYFTFSNNDTIDYPNSSLQEKIDSLKFQVVLKENDIKSQSAENVTLKKQNLGLRQEVGKLEAQIDQKNNAIHALNTQIKFFQAQAAQADYLKLRIDHLKSKIRELKPIKTLLQSPLSDVSRLTQNTKDPDVLTRYISVMKKELIQSFDKCKKLQRTVKRLKEELNKNTTKTDVSLEEQEQTSLEEKLGASESLLNIDNNDVSETGSQSNSSKEIIPLEGDSTTAENQMTLNKCSVIKHTYTNRNTNEMSLRSANSVQDKIQTPLIELNMSSDVEFVNCSSSGRSSTVPTTFCLIQGDLTNSTDGINQSKLRKRRKVQVMEDTSCSNVIDLT